MSPGFVQSSIAAYHSHKIDAVVGIALYIRPLNQTGDAYRCHISKSITCNSSAPSDCASLASR